MNAPNSASLGAMGSLLRKLDELCINQDQDMLLSQSLQELRDGLRSICSSLEKLSEVNDPSLTASYWMKDARELSYDTEDFLDQCFFVQGDNSDAVRFMDEISGFQARVEEVADRYGRYKIEFILSHATNMVAAANHFRIVHQYMDPFVPIGMENITNSLIEWIEPKDDDKEDNQLKVASILGVQGVGKTTLAQKLWNDESTGKFDYRAFVQTAKRPDMRMILISILSQVLLTQTPEAHNVQNLIQALRRHLQDKRVLITTTIEDVALACCSYESEHVFQMEPLGDDHSKQLFVDRVFGNGNVCPPQFNNVSEEITRKCGGLPLAIICIASHIASQPETVYQWEKVQNFLCHNLRTNATSVEILKQAFNLCYNSLPQCLKTCLLYLTVYPENYLILKEDLLKQWMAEGFICTREEEENIFEVACSYFNWLVSLGLIQRMDINCNKKGAFYVVHPMLFDFVTCKSTEDNFITIIDYSQSTLALSDMIRRLSVHFGSATYASMPESLVLWQVRTLTFMGLLNCLPSLVNFKLVRVVILHLRGDDVDKSFSLTGICGLLLLRYLQVKCNVSVELPEQMGCLKQLETLEINSRVTVVPLDIFHLSRLLNVRLGGKSDHTMGQDFSVKADYSSSPTPPVSLQTLELLPPICIFSKLPEWFPKLGELCSLEIVFGELCVSDINIIAELPALRALCLYVRTPIAGKIVFRGGAFLALEYFKFFCGILFLDFQEETMPKIRKLKIGFNAHRGMEYDNMLDGIHHLLNLREVAARIGAATGAGESDRRAAESAFRNSVRIHQSIKVKRVGQVDEVCGPSVEQNWSHQKESSRRESEDLPIKQHGVLGGMATEVTKKEADIGGQWNAASKWEVLAKAATPPRAGVNLLGLIVKIQQAARTARQNKADCDHLARRADELPELFKALRPRLHVEPGTARTALALGDTLVEAYDLVVSCQGHESANNLWTARRKSERFKDVEKKLDTCLRNFPVISQTVLGRRLDGRLTTTAAANGGGEDTTTTTTMAAAVAQGVVVFTMAEITVATNNFAVDLTVGVSATVYKGKLHDGREVAVKRRWRGADADAAFDTELAILAPLRHHHIVRLVGLCADDGERITVTQLMTNGSLYDHLHGEWSRRRRPSSLVTSSWKARVQVLVGVARGVEHLHQRAVPRVIHGRVTSSHVLLGDDDDTAWSPRLTGFGMSVCLAAGVDSQPVAAVADPGVHWNADPEIRSIGRIRPASDVYSFGVVMLETLIGRPAMMTVWDERSSSRATNTLVSFTLPNVQARRLLDVLDRRPVPEPTALHLEPLEMVATTAARCLSLRGDDRPGISEVVINLERALQIICTRGNF